MTYDELAGLLECSPEAASALVERERLYRKMSHDGRARVKLSLPLIGLFMAKIRVTDQPLDQAIQDIRRMHVMMRSYEERHEQTTDRASTETAVSAVG